MKKDNNNKIIDLNTIKKEIELKKDKLKEEEALEKILERAKKIDWD